MATKHKQALAGSCRQEHSLAAREWRKTAGLEVMAQRPKKHLGPVSVAIELGAPDRRAFDIDNRSKALLDLLVMCRVIEADNSDVVRELHIRLGEGFTGARVFVRPPTSQSG